MLHQGLGEHDRKPISDLIRVENGFENDGFLRIEPGYKLCKGGKRVTILNSTKSAAPIDIILHDDEAYTRTSIFSFEDNTHSKLDIEEMSSSIHQSLAVVRENMTSNN